MVLTAVAPAPPTPKPPPARRRTSGVTPEGVSHLVAAGLGSFGVVWVAYERLLPLSGAIGFWLLWYALAVALYAALAATTEGRVGVVDKVMRVLFSTAGAVLVAVLAGIVLFTAKRGLEAVLHLSFFTETMARTSPEAPLDQGGILAAMVGTLEQVALSVVISVPLGIATAVYLHEVGGRLARLVRVFVEAMSAVPTIVAGLFIYSLLILSLGQEGSGFAAALALSISMIPVVTMTSLVVLRLVPHGLREASYALGAGQWETVRGVVLPTARPGLVTAVLLGVARVIGETAPVLLVAGFTRELQTDPFHGPQVSLPLFTFNSVRQPLDEAIARGFGSAVVLLALVGLFFGLARVVGGRPVGTLSRRQRRRLARSLTTRAPEESA